MKSTFHHHEKRLYYFLIIPALTVVAVAAFYPTAVTFWMSFREVLLIFRVNKFIGLGNYRNLLQDSNFSNALINTFYFTFASVGLETLIGLGIALVIHESFPGRGVVRVAVLVPWAIPTVVTSTMWKWIFNTNYGMLNYLLKKFGFISVNQNWLGSPALAMLCAIFADVWKTTPFIALITLAGLQTVSNDLHEAAIVDGANGWQRFKSITFPLIMPILTVAVLLRSLDAFRVFALIFVLTGGGPADSTEVLSTYTYKILFSTSNFGYGSALATSMFLSVAFITFLFLLLLRGENKLR
ncbi:sugar ABC transporter permease [Patescibacteria group bacterium]|nr:sugar ABC transporter permease [Patescibacteria group bacterium]